MKATEKGIHRLCVALLIIIAVVVLTVAVNAVIYTGWVNGLYVVMGAVLGYAGALIYDVARYTPHEDEADDGEEGE